MLLKSREVVSLRTADRIVLKFHSRLILLLETLSLGEPKLIIRRYFCITMFDAAARVYAKFYVR